MQCGDFIGAPHWLFGEVMSGGRELSFFITSIRGNVGTSACSVRGFYSRKSRQSRHRLRAIFREIRGIITQCVLFGRCTQRPYPLTPLLRRICYSLFLSIRVCDPTIENMFFCSSVEKVHRITEKIVLWRAAEGTTVDFVFLLLTRHKMPVIFCTCFVRRFGNPQASLVFRSLNRTFAYHDTI